MSIEQCEEPWRMLTALGAAFFLLGVRFALLRWRELAFAEERIARAVHDAEKELRSGVSVLRSPDATRGLAERQTAADDSQVVQARSDPPGPLL